MAFTFLTHPATSTEPHCVFSTIHITLSDSHCRMLDDVLETIECFRSGRMDGVATATKENVKTTEQMLAALCEEDVVRCMDCTCQRIDELSDIWIEANPGPPRRPRADASGRHWVAEVGSRHRPATSRPEVASSHQRDLDVSVMGNGGRGFSFGYACIYRVRSSLAQGDQATEFPHTLSLEYF